MADAFALAAGIVGPMSSAVTLFEAALRSLKRYEKCSTDLEHIQRQIRTQNAVFRNVCRLILASLSTREVAMEMIENYQHPAWATPDLEFEFSNHAVGSNPIYARVMSSIEEKLVVIERELVELQIVLDQLYYSKSAKAKIRCSRGQRRRKAASAISCLRFHLDGLQRLNSEFLNFSSQTCDIKRAFSNIDPLTSLKSEKRLEEFRFVQRASLQLHYALTLACLAHIEHPGYFNLEPDHVSIHNSGTSSVNFSIAFRGCATDGDPSGMDTNWLAIRSAFYEPRTEINAGHDPMTQNPVSAFTKAFAAANDILHTSIVVHNLKTTQWVRFHRDQSSNLSILEDTDHSLDDFSAGHHFCFYKRSLILRRRGDICIGYLEMVEPTGTWRHLLYVMPRTAVASNHSRESLSLAQLYYSVSPENGVGDLSIYVKLQLALKLATAVLCLHSTPWLHSSWGSNDVLFFGTHDNSVQQDRPLAFPHLKFRVAKEHQQEGIASGASNWISEGFSHNSELFNLGILLLELGYSKPLSSLRDSVDFTSCKEGKFTDFLLAKRLSLTLGRRMGAVYARIVQKCLRCDFGECDDLSDLATQAVFYKDIVCELERLEECVKELEIGD